MPPTLAPSLVAMDILCCMGLGFFVAMLRVLTPVQGAVACFVADACASFFALLLAQIYAAQSSNAGLLRFYMVVALAIGAFSFVQVFAAYLLFLFGVLRCMVTAPGRIVFHKLVLPAFSKAKAWIIVQKGRNTKKHSEKIAKKQLQNHAVLLYNSNVDLYTFAE